MADLADIILNLLQQNSTDPKREQTIIAEAGKLGHSASDVSSTIRALERDAKVARVNPPTQEFGIWKLTSPRASVTFCRGLSTLSRWF